jgi:hypothetical protein
VLDARASAQDQPGSIRGVVSDRDFDVPLADALVTVAETGQKAVTSEQGNYVIQGVPPGRYTLVFSKDGFVRQVRADVLVSAGQLTDADAALAGEFTEMDEFVVQDILAGGTGSEAAMLKLRLDSPAFMDSISSDLMSRAGASDAASALTLVSGASVEEGKFAVIRGLPDRYVNSQLNGVRLPTADEDKRAVELDQFPAAVIESVQVSKTFTPDQQGDASGGAVNVRLKSIPEETVLLLNTQVSANSQVYDSDFLTYDGGGLDFWGNPNTGHGIQFDNIGSNWDGAVGTTTEDPPFDYKWSATAGGKQELPDGITIGGLASFFYERDSSFYDNGKDDSLWVVTPGGPMTPQFYQGTPLDGDFKTGLFDVTQGTEAVQWGGLASVGAETENNQVGLTYLYTQTDENTATLAIDTRGKEFFFPGYNPNNPMGIGNDPGSINAAPYLRTETLEYTERTTSLLQLDGKHRLPWELGGWDGFRFLQPELDWYIASSKATLDQPDKRQFGALWLPSSFHPPGFLPPFFTPPTWFPYKPAANFNLGNEQRIFKDIEEQSDQYGVNLKFPFEQWSGDQGYAKFGVFDDQTDRDFNQDTFSNFGDSGSSFEGDFDEPWSGVFPGEPNHPITPADTDVDYKGDQHIQATYGMMDLPLTSAVKLIGGARWESTELSIKNQPEPGAKWVAPGESTQTNLDPGEADVDFQQDDVLPAIAMEVKPLDQVTVRASYSGTVARQTFKELTPIVQQEYLGGPIFIGNPELGMSSLDNTDLRVDYTPHDGALLSASWFHKNVNDPIEYVQKVVDFNYTTAVNYPEGELTGYELEARERLGEWWSSLEGFSIGANATFINSQVTLPGDEADKFEALDVHMATRDMTNAPDHLYNFYFTFDMERTQLALFYTITGDTLVAGAAEASGNFVPNVYAKEFGTLNFTASHKLGDHATVVFQAKNLTNPAIEEVYRGPGIDNDVTRSSYTKGREVSLGLNIRF